MSRTILVTGGGTGIGRAIAARFTAAGDAVVVTGRRPEPLRDAAAALGDTARAITCDHTDPYQVASLADALDKVDVLVNNAGGNTDFDADAPDNLAAPAGSAPESLRTFARTWRANLDANLLSAALTTEAVRDRLATDGSVVHIGSIAADKGAGAYGAAKAGLASWNIDLARELGPRGITCNVVSAGYIEETEFFRDRLSQQRRERLIADTATKRPGTVADIAETVFFLATPGARHITGQVLNVNGGAFASR